MGARATVVTAASANGIFIDLFSPNGWLLQILFVSTLAAFRDALAPVIVAYPTVIIVEVLSIALVDRIGMQKALIIAYCGRMIAIFLLLIAFGFYPSSAAFFVSYYVTFIFHVVGFHVAWPQFVRRVVPAATRGEILGQARAAAGGVSIAFLALLYVLSRQAPDRVGIAALMGVITISIVSFLAVAQSGKLTSGADSPQPPQDQQIDGSSLMQAAAELIRSADFRSVLLQTCALSVAIIPLPLIFLGQSMSVPKSSIMLALLAALAVSTALMPRFGRYIDHNFRHAYLLLLVIQVGTMFLIFLLGLTASRMPQASLILLSTFAIILNSVGARFAGLLTYKRALDLGSQRATAMATLVITWTFDLAAWLVATVTVLSLTSGLIGDQAGLYALICGIAGGVAVLILVLETKAQKVRS